MACRDGICVIDDLSLYDVLAGDSVVVDASGASDASTLDTDAPEDDKGPCQPDCLGNTCGQDPVCNKLSCGKCSDEQFCKNGMCVANQMALIPSGNFWMGCNQSPDTKCQTDEMPYHEVMLSAYYIDRTEVTQGEYKKCVDDGSCPVPECSWSPENSSDRPVVCVNWTQAQGFCEWVGKRLPTEAEWEKAARGTDGRKYPWGNEAATCDLAVIADCSGSVMDVCSKSPFGDSPYGICDMAGNVWEWVFDWYDSGYYAKCPSSNPIGADFGSCRGVRSGGFVYPEAGLQTFARACSDPSYSNSVIGFRCARSQ